ncbi:MAG TPA: glycosyltransferase family 4 protein, partial [Elusimicrobiales bacterium]|nr:glycosyltransferase family 4 protein [Elusimicrobiales bacterium]
GRRRGVKVLIVTQYFWPENFRVNDLALGLKERGHEVTVLTGQPNYPGGRFFEGYGALSRSEERYEGIRVCRVPVVSRGPGKGLRLALNYLSFAISASLLGPFYCREKYGAVFVFEPSPVTVAIPGIVMRELKGAPLFLWVLDLWPESLSATGAVSSGTILRMVGAMVRFIYRNCDRILVSSRGFTERVVAAGFPEKSVSYFPNWVEDVYAGGSAVVAEPQDLPDGFRVVFAGNLGAAQGLPTILAAAEKLRGDTGLHWVLIGDGRMADWLRVEVSRRGLSGTVHLLGRHEPGAMPGFFSAADALLVSLRRDPAFTLTVPGKVQSYMACGRPLIASLEGEGAALIAESGSGLVCPPEDPEALAAAVTRLKNMSVDERVRMGKAGAAYAAANFSRGDLLNRLADWIETAAKK